MGVIINYVGILGAGNRQVFIGKTGEIYISCLATMFLGLGYLRQKLASAHWWKYYCWTSVLSGVSSMQSERISKVSFIAEICAE